ncbi:MAG: hypothetical protein GXY33_04885 [Phycisphaerae bacterium]|nr:hypothetical protein [Phycisphaerae bacterium]
MKAILCAMTLLASTTLAIGQTQNDQQDQPRIVELAVTPAAAPVPTLKYRLAPGVLDQTAGNAALLYNGAALEASAVEGIQTLNQTVADLLAKPASELDRGQAKAAIDQLAGPLRYVQLAADRSECHWDRPLSQGFAMHLPELSSLRALARALALRARLAALDGRFDDAVDDLQTGFAMAGHIAEGPTVIEALVAAAVGSLMAEQVEQLVQTPNAPNLYWALTALPDQMASMSRPYQYEMALLYLTFPKLRDIRTHTMTADECDAIIDALARLIGMDDGSASDSGWPIEKTLLALKAYPEAKRHLLDHGWTIERIEAKPVQQIILIYYLDDYERVQQSLAAWSYLPYGQASDGMRKAVREFETLRATHFNPFYSLLPALERALFLSAKLDRQIAALRTVEALRLYAAEHDRRLPESLADVAEAPVPLDPVTGRPFAYRLENGRAILDAPAPQGIEPKHGLRYIVTISR